MKNGIKSLILSIAIIGTASVLVAQTKAPVVSRKGKSGEVKLVGVNLYDSGKTVIAKFGNPDQVLPLSISYGGAAGGGGAGGGGGAPGPSSGGGGMQPSGGGGGSSGVAPQPGGRSGGRGGGGGPTPTGGYTGPNNGMIGDPFGTQSGRQSMVSQGLEGEGGSPSGRGGGSELSLNPNAGGGGGSGATGTSERVTFTRWVYKRSGSRYAFIMDKFNRVVQIEAVGMGDKNVRTKRGVAFGSTFADVIRKYDAPDGYEIGGSTIVMRYLVNDKVAFRLTRLDPNKPHVVTGIVVAAGKQ